MEGLQGTRVILAVSCGAEKPSQPGRLPKELGAGPCVRH